MGFGKIEGEGEVDEGYQGKDYPHEWSFEERVCKSVSDRPAEHYPAEGGTNRAHQRAGGLGDTIDFSKGTLGWTSLD